MSTEQHDGFEEPVEVDDVATVFGGNIKKLLPPYDAIPDTFKQHRGKWNNIVSMWFFGGLPEGTRLVPKVGINRNKALAHLRAIMVSWQPKHEHKEAGVAWLMSRWFSDVIVPKSE